MHIEQIIRNREEKLINSLYEKHKKEQEIGDFLAEIYEKPNNTEVNNNIK